MSSARPYSTLEQKFIRAHELFVKQLSLSSTYTVLQSSKLDLRFYKFRSLSMKSRTLEHKTKAFHVWHASKDGIDVWPPSVRSISVHLCTTVGNNVDVAVVRVIKHNEDLGTWLPRLQIYCPLTKFSATLLKWRS